MKLPEKGKPHEELLTEMRALQGGDADWRNGKIFSLVYFAGDDVADHDAAALDERVPADAELLTAELRAGVERPRYRPKPCQARLRSRLPEFGPLFGKVRGYLLNCPVTFLAEWLQPKSFRTPNCILRQRIVF